MITSVMFCKREKFTNKTIKHTRDTHVTIAMLCCSDWNKITFNGISCKYLVRKRFGCAPRIHQYSIRIQSDQNVKATGLHLINA